MDKVTWYVARSSGIVAWALILATIVWGLLLAVPIMVSIKAAADRIEPLQPLGELLGR